MDLLLASREVQDDHGTQGVAAATNIPGARDNMVSWTDAGGNVWLFGGEGLNSTGADPNAPLYRAREGSRREC